jgi:GNAT superfamily N-acetyltransferase
MWWRLKRSEFERQKGEGNRKAMKTTVDSGEVPGLLAYAGDVPVGWCSVAPRDSFPVLNRSRILKKIDDMPVWSIVCFFIDKKSRNRGVSVQLLRAVIASRLRLDRACFGLQKGWFRRGGSSFGDSADHEILYLERTKEVSVEGMLPTTSR